MTKVKLVPEYTVFTVMVDDVDIGQFREISEWEGFRKLCKGGETLIVTNNEKPSSFANSFGDTFAKVFGDSAFRPDFFVVKATPETQVAINAAQTKKAAA